MLYLPWRNYSDILGGYITYEARYNDNSEEIEVKRKNYVCALTENIAQIEREVLSVHQKMNQQLQNLSTKMNVILKGVQICQKNLNALIQESTMGIMTMT